jgi:hypothetical protein
MRGPLGRPLIGGLLLEVSGDKRYLAQPTSNAYGLNAASTRGVARRPREGLWMSPNTAHSPEGVTSAWGEASEAPRGLLKPMTA